MTLEHRLSPLRKQGSTQCSGWIPVYTGLNDLLVQSRKSSTKRPVSLSPAWERVRVRGQVSTGKGILYRRIPFVGRYLDVFGENNGESLLSRRIAAPRMKIAQMVKEPVLRNIL